MNPLIKIPDELIAPLFKQVVGGVVTTTPIFSMGSHRQLLVSPSSVGATEGDIYSLFFVATFDGHDWRALVPIASAGEYCFFLSFPDGWNYPFIFEKILPENRHETPEQFIERVKP